MLYNHEAHGMPDGCPSADEQGVEEASCEWQPRTYNWIGIWVCAGRIEVHRNLGLMAGSGK